MKTNILSVIKLMGSDLKLEILKVYLILPVLIILFLIAGCSNNENNNQEDTLEIVPLTKHWEIAVPHQKIPKGLKTLSAEECGTCHKENYLEWKRANHSKAWEDLQFQAEWKKDKKLWVCINCHTPLQDQQEFIITGKENGDYFKPVKKLNPFFDPELQKEAITCAVCHVRDGVVIGPYGNSESSPHAVKKDIDFLSSKLCMSCHNVLDEVNPTLVCTFGTGEEWKESPYQQSGQNCVTCHMPSVYRRLTSYTEPRWTRQHTFIGSAVPKTMGKDKIVKDYISGLDINVQLSPVNSAWGDSSYITVTLTNQRAGHYIPTGDPEHFISLQIRLMTEDNDVLRDTSFTIAQKWKWWPKAIKLSDNRLKALETRNYYLAAEVSEPPQQLFYEVIVTMNRMTTIIAEYAKLLGKYPIKAVIYNQRFQLVTRD
jgi:Cytochrome c554 and c-prime